MTETTTSDVEQAVRRVRLCVSHVSFGSRPGRQGLVQAESGGSVRSCMREESAGPRGRRLSEARSLDLLPRRPPRLLLSVGP